ncbi:DgyrCDS2440 [Dimorphilus gyrociliatus]|uniref:Protein CLP1 homolog n=1 Tax=Dimorphilus gyrociliatus TaxID=2664684 RepID=A0A7I8VAI8_9ANNE|nr:DgyrCDS2440 [Dimorphilus gyrociliatus]
MDVNLPKVEYDLQAHSELRFEVEVNEPIQLELLEGTAEIYGSELVKGCVYKFYRGRKVAVFTAKETPMVLYVNVHAGLEQMRDQAAEQKSRGPRIMLAGPTDVGKSTICKMLVSWAARLKRTPILVDLDVGQPDLSIPGTIGASVIETPVDIEEGYNLSGPLIFHFGHITPQNNIDLYKVLISRLAEAVSMRAQNIEQTNYSGVVINTCGWVRDGGYRSIVHAAGAFEVDVVVVLDQERLYSELLRDMPEFVKVIMLQKSGGVVERTRTVRETTRDKKIYEYFYGTREQALYPHTFEVQWSSVKFFKIGGPDLPESMLPVGITLADNKTKVVSVTPSRNLMYHVCSVSTANTEKEIIQSNAAGFVVITQIDINKESVTLLSPSPGPLPFPYLLVMEDVKYNDELRSAIYKK